MAIKARIGFELFGIEAMADHLLIGDVLWQMAHPAAHQIQHGCARGDALAVQRGQPGAEAGIEVLYEAGLGVKKSVV